MKPHLEVLAKSYTPAAVGTTETKDFFEVKKGDRILWGLVRQDVVNDGSTPTLAIRASAAAGGQAAGLLSATNAYGQTAGAVFNFNGPDIPNAGGFLCTGDGTIQMVYTAGVTVGTVAPQYHVRVTVVRHDHFA